MDRILDPDRVCHAGVQRVRQDGVLVDHDAGERPALELDRALPALARITRDVDNDGAGGGLDQIPGAARQGRQVNGPVATDRYPGIAGDGVAAAGAGGQTC